MADSSYWSNPNKSLWWACLFSPIFITTAIWLYSAYFAIRRVKYGIVTPARVLKTYESQDGEQGWNRQVQFEYTDSRETLSAECIGNVISRFVHSSTNGLVPGEVVDLIKQYVGRSFTFYFGPFTVEQSVESAAYNKARDCDEIDILYDSQYPQLARINQHKTRCDHAYKTMKYIGYLSGIIGLCFGGIAFNAELRKHPIGGAWSYVLLMFAISLAAMCCFMACCCWVDATCCFTKSEQRILRCERSEEV